MRLSLPEGGDHKNPFQSIKESLIRFICALAKANKLGNKCAFSSTSSTVRIDVTLMRKAHQLLLLWGG